MRKGKCPRCKEIKEITEAGVMNGMCDDCYKEKYTCVVCGEMVTDAWTLYHDPKIGSGHDTCLMTNNPKK